MLRMRVAGGLCLILSALLVGGATQLVRIGTETGSVLRSRATRQQTASWMIMARRGDMLDARGRVLAGTVRRPSVFVDPGMITDARYTAYSIAPLLGLDADALERDLYRWQGETRFVWLKRLVTSETHATIDSVVEGRDLRGIGIQFEMVREYPQQQEQPLAPHVLGFVGRDRYTDRSGQAYEDLRGLAGLEAHYNDLLRGTPGRRTVTVDRARRPVRVPAETLEPAQDGATLVLTLDAYIQEATQRVLRAAVAEHQARWGVAVVLDPATGEVLAMATIPDFDPAAAIPVEAAERSEAERDALAERWRNRAVADAFEPGSIFKPFIAASALEEGVVQLDEEFVINGPAHDFGSRVVHDVHAYDRLALWQIISKSSNIGMGLVGDRCGCERLHEYVRRFGFGSPTGIGLPGESPGLVMPLSQWNPRFSPQSVAMGHEVGVTSIQMVSAFAAFANGGLLLQPRIVRGVIGPAGQVWEDHSEPVVVRRVLGAETADTFRTRALVEVVRDGTGHRAALDHYQVFGKTGTAEVSEPGRGYLEDEYVGSFIGGAPADDPRVVALVSIYKPGGKAYYGGTVAAPAAREILAATLEYLQVPPGAPTKAEAGALARHMP